MNPFAPVPFDGPPGPNYTPLDPPAFVPTKPGPQPWNAGITPGYRRPRPDDDDPATLAHVRRLLRRLLREGRRIDDVQADVRELAGAVAAVEGKAVRA